MTYARDLLAPYQPCADALAWIGERTLAEAWQTCGRPDWMLWAAVRLVPAQAVPACAALARGWASAADADAADAADDAADAAARYAARCVARCVAARYAAAAAVAAAAAAHSAARYAAAAAHSAAAHSAAARYVAARRRQCDQIRSAIHWGAI